MSDIKIDIDVADNGTTAKVTKNADILKNSLEGAAAAATRTAKAVASAHAAMQNPDSLANRTASNAGSIAKDRDYGVVRGVVGTGAAGRDFAKQAQGLGGLVALYATFAANIFAVGAAFEALNKAAATERLAKATEMMSISTGLHLKAVSKNLVEASGYALSFSEAMQFTNIGTSAGLASKQIESLTKIAKGAASALGRDVGDSVRRIIQGTAKQEQEILDELGIFLKASQAYEKFSEANKIKVADMTGAQRTQAYANEVERLGTKWNEFAEIPDPFSKFTAIGKNALNELLVSVNKVFIPLLNFLSESQAGIQALILLITAGLTRRAVPELGTVLTNLFTFDKARIAKAAQDAQQVLLDNYTETTSKLAANKRARDALLIPTVDRASIASTIGPLSASRTDRGGISAERVATALVGTKTNPKNDLAAYTAIAQVNETITRSIKEQLKDSKHKDVVLKGLIEKDIIENTLSAESVVLGSAGLKVSQDIFASISATNVAMATKNALEAEGALLSKQALADKKNIANIPLSVPRASAATSMPAAAVVGGVINADTASIAANTTSIAANTVAQANNTAAQVSNTAAQASNIIATDGRTKALAAGLTVQGAYNKGLATTAVFETNLAAAGGNLWPTLKLIAIEMGAAALSAGGFATSAVSASAASGLLGASVRFLSLGIKGLLATLSAVMMPVMIAWTAWEMFGDTIKKWLGISGEADKSLAAQKDKLKEFSEGTALAAASMERLNALRLKGTESSEEKIKLDSIESTIINEQVARIKALTAAEEAHAAEISVAAARKRSEDKGLVFSEKAYLAEQLAKASSIAGDKAKSDTLVQLTKDYQLLAEVRATLDKDPKAATGISNEYKLEVEARVKQGEAVYESLRIEREQRQAHNGKVLNLNKAFNDAIEHSTTSAMKKGSETLGIYSEKAVASYNNMVKMFTSSGIGASDFSNTLSGLATMIEGGGKKAAAAAPLYLALSKILTDPKASTSAGLAALLEESKTELTALILAVNKGLDTGKPAAAAKAISPYSEKSKAQFTALKNDIDAISVRMKTLAADNSVRKATDDILNSINGVASASSIASDRSYVESVAKQNNIKAEKEAYLELQKVLQDRTKKGADGRAAIAEAQNAYDFKVKESKITEKEQIELARITALKSTASRIAGEMAISAARASEKEKISVALKEQALTAETNALELKKSQGFMSEKEAIQAQLLLDIKKQQLATESSLSTLDTNIAARATPFVAQVEANYGDSAVEVEARAAAIAQLLIISTEYDNQRTLIANNALETLNYMTAVATLKEEQAGHNEQMERMVSITESLSTIFGELGTKIGSAGKAILKMAQQEENYLNKKKALTKDIKDSTPDSKDDIKDIKLKAAIAKKSSTDLIKLEEKRRIEELDGISETSGAVKSMFNEKTAAHKAFAIVEKVTAAASMALKIQGMALDLVTLPIKIKAGIGSLFAQGGWAGFAGAAAFLAMMGSFGGGGSTAAPQAGFSAKDLQETQGTGMQWVEGKKVATGGGVFGDTEAKSESIKNSLEILKDNSNEEMFYANKMVTLLTSISNGINGVAKNIYAVVGIRTGSISGTKEGTSGKTTLGFGTTKNVEIANSGIAIKGSFGQLMGGTGGTMTGFEDVLTTTTKSSVFGLYKKTRQELKRNSIELDANISDNLTSVFKNAGTLFITLGNELGMTTEQVLSKLGDIPVDKLISLRGLKGAELETELSAVLGSILDDTTTTLFEGLDKYKKFGEGMLETTIRVIDGLTKVNISLDSIGIASVGLGMKGIEVSESLIEAAGDLDTFISKVSFFSENFLTDAERLAPVSQNLATQMALLGLSGVTTREQFKTTVQSLDLSTQKGRSLYTSLMNLAPAFDKVAQAVEGIQAVIDGIHESVTSSIFGMRYGLQDNPGKYAMLDAKAAGIDERMRTSSDIYTVGKLAEEQIALINQAWGLLDVTQQRASLSKYEAKLQEIDQVVSDKGARAIDIARTRDKETADAIAAAVKTAVESAMAKAAADIAVAAAAIVTAAEKPAVAEISVNVTKSPGVEVSISGSRDY